MSEIDWDEIEGRLQKIPCGAIRWGEWTTGTTLHEVIKGNLVNMAGYNGYYGIPEMTCNPDSEDRKRIDVGWLNRTDYEPVYAFQVCGGVPENSIQKLQRLPDSVEKIVVSKSPNSSYINNAKAENLPDDFHHIDLEAYK